MTPFPLPPTKILPIAHQQQAQPPTTSTRPTEKMIRTKTSRPYQTVVTNELGEFIARDAAIV